MGLGEIDGDGEVWRFEMVIPRDEPMQLLLLMNALDIDFKMNPTEDVKKMVEDVENKLCDGEYEP